MSCLLTCAAIAIQAIQPPTPGENFTDTIPGAALTFDMIWIEDGGFWIGATEVTWDEYLAYCAFEDADRNDKADAISRPSKPLEVRAFDHGWGKGKRPAIGVSWQGAKTYCAWLSHVTGNTYSLPTETEWALACGPAPQDIHAHAWIASNSDAKTHEVAQKQPNAQGVYDMLGNVWEYCANPYDERRPDKPVFRGGCFRDDSVDPATRLPFDNDWTLDDPGFPPGQWWIPDGEHLGFRIVCRPPEDMID